MKKPEWLRVPYVDLKSCEYITGLLEKYRLNTVCVEANCPNKPECFSKKTATFMILGNICTRNCTFCNVSSGTPQTLDENEPQRIAAAVKELELKYVVITSVTRDDLPDSGANHFADVIKEIHKTSPETVVEVLIPDLDSLKVITDQSPAVISHNIETVKSLYPYIRPEADYHRSLEVLKTIKELAPNIHSKSGLMLGLGETKDEVLQTFDDLRSSGCEILTIGQYLSPGKNHYPVKEYIKPEMFEEYKSAALKSGFIYVSSAPFVRSSYKAAELYNKK